ncbi:hypothetical protein [Chryseobacterium indoltheticum]|uniref:hypothetical protein n=1 Tax=Chryseobacterium indoltheticum TaxID=254 RepID=UPI0040420C35
MTFLDKLENSASDKLSFSIDGMIPLAFESFCMIKFSLSANWWMKSSPIASKFPNGAINQGKSSGLIFRPRRITHCWVIQS